MSGTAGDHARTPSPHHVVIVGGGFGGLSAALAFRQAPVRVTLLDRRNFHLFQPLLYQVATGGLSPANIASPLREILKHQRNTRVLLGEVVDLDRANRLLRLHDGLQVSYDTLIVAAGAQTDYFSQETWKPLAPGLKTIEDATEIRRRILLAFEMAERESQADKAQAWLTFVIVGAGPTGVELAGAIAEIAKDTLKHNFRTIHPERARILLLEGNQKVLPSYPPQLSDRVANALARLGVTVRTGVLVSDIQASRLTIRMDQHTEQLAAQTILWAAGVRGSSLGRVLANAVGCTLDEAGRVVVEPDLSVPGHPELFVIGDLAHVRDRRGGLLPGLAPVAMQEGRYVAKRIQERLRNRPYPPFRYRDYGRMATIGRARAVADFGWAQLSGLPAWLAWLFIHLLGLVAFENRLLVSTQWAWNYFTRNRTARLITGEAPAP